MKKLLALIAIVSSLSGCSTMHEVGTDAVAVATGIVLIPLILVSTPPEPLAHTFAYQGQQYTYFTTDQGFPINPVPTPYQQVTINPYGP